MASTHSIHRLCSRWFGAAVIRVEPLRTTGFSGSQVFGLAVPATGDRFVLKSFPEAGSSDQARWVHGLVRHLRSEGLVEVPEVMATPEGDTVVEDDLGRLWEVSRFMPGLAVPGPSPPQARAAAACLARLHLAAARLPAAAPRGSTPPTLVRRLAQARRLLESPWRLGAAISAARTASAQARTLAEGVLERIEAAIRLSEACGLERLLLRVVAKEPKRVPLQACLRDVWHEHVLFAARDGACVTAVIDLHAAAIDAPVTDVARLLGSWIPARDREGLPLAERWREAIAAYDAVRPLAAAERTLVPLLHGTGVVLGLDNWFRWILVEHRIFPDAERVLARIDALIGELPAAVADAWHAVENDD